MTNDTTYRFWKHENGDVYAIRFGADEVGIMGSDITGVCGPLHHSDREEPLDDFEYETEDVDWVIDNSGSFRDVTTPAEYANRRYA